MPKTAKNHYSVVIIGAGAAGLMCGLTAGSRGKDVLILDHTNKVGKKILMSGGGRCNFTNYSIEPENYLSNNPHFCKSALSRYTQWDFLALVDKYEVDYYEKTLGQLFCKNSAKDIRDLLLSECQQAGVEIKLKSNIEKVKTLDDSGFQISIKKIISKNELSGEHKITCDKLVIATGGLSIPTMGASGFAYQVAEQFGHQVIKTRPGLTPLTFDSAWRNKTSNLPGNAFDAIVTCNNISFKEAVLFTHKGLSGPAILQISNYWQPGDEIKINFFPEIDVFDWLVTNKINSPEKNLKTLLSSQVSQAIATFLCDELNANQKLKHLEKIDIQRIAGGLNGMTFNPAGYEGYRVAEVTIGGVNNNEISSRTFESNIQPGLHFIGECIDVTGHLGGYNFQWAWASGNAAGLAI